MVELADIFQREGMQYRTKYGNHMLPSHQQTMRDLSRCRTSELGGHVYSCPACGDVQYQYHSCRNRHCPKCQGQRGREWLEKQQEILLPVPYFLLTFTLPEGLRSLARSNQHLFYNTLFRTSAAAAKRLALDPDYVGGQIGLVGVLHTWGRDLTYHPHVHYLVPAGGIGKDGEWLPVRNNFLFPVMALSKIFRAKFRDALQKDDCFEHIPAQVWKQDWVVHCQTIGRGVGALKYLAPYIFRVAISNRRIVGFAGGKVTYLYKPHGTKKFKRCTLTADEFIRRFLQHVLPRGFVKVRYYGFLSSAVRPKLKTLRAYLEKTYSCQREDVQGSDDASALSQKHPLCCPVCGCRMKLKRTIPRKGRSPP
ncbi:MAG: IS91 family transposase [Anaerolineales bacterium]